MTDSETDYSVTPANNTCSNTVNNSVTVASPGSQNANTSQNIASVNNQHIADSQYDNVDSITVKPLYGGKNKNIFFTIKFLNKIVNINAIDEISAIKLFLNNKIYKRDHLLEIKHNNISSVYIIRAGYKNKLVRCV